MLKKNKNISQNVILLALAVLMMISVLSAPILARAEGSYDAVIIDDADLLTDSQEQGLLEKMEPCTTYGHAVFYSTNENYGDPDSVARSKFNELYGNNTVSGVLFLIDMSNRHLIVYSSGDASYVISSSKANSISDNVYKYASDGNYYECASEVFEEVGILLDGGKISQPMKLVSNIFLAMIIGLLIAYGLVKSFSAVAKPSEKELLAAIQTKQNLLVYQKVFTHQTRRYDPPSSSSSGGGGGGGGGGHSSSGGHSF